MAFDEEIATRIRNRLGARSGLAEKKMFGGMAFLLNGNMCCGVHGQGLIVRVEPAEAEAALSEPHTRVFDLTGRPMKGWIVVAPEGLAADAALGKWVELSTRYAESLPPK